MHSPIPCWINVNGLNVQGAICPICHVKRYPAREALKCVRNHAIMAKREGMRICNGCHQPKPKKDIKCYPWTCGTCRSKTQKAHCGPNPYNKLILFQEYLAKRTYHWEK
jgi:hypothetical protein